MLAMLRIKGDGLNICCGDEIMLWFSIWFIIINLLLGIVIYKNIISNNVNNLIYYIMQNNQWNYSVRSSF